MIMSLFTKHVFAVDALSSMVCLTILLLRYRKPDFSIKSYKIGFKNTDRSGSAIFD